MVCFLCAEVYRAIVRNIFSQRFHFPLSLFCLYRHHRDCAFRSSSSTMIADGGAHYSAAILITVITLWLCNSNRLKRNKN